MADEGARFRIPEEAIGLGDVLEGILEEIVISEQRFACNERCDFDDRHVGKWYWVGDYLK